jgi:hypothetical protein
MDRDFLSSPRFVAASKEWVCARLLTYESAEEAKVLTSFFVGRSGQLENTTFVLVSPDGKTALTRAGRSPEMALGGRGRDDDALSDLLAKQAARFRAKPESSKEAPLLPTLVDVRRGLDVAACDLLPLAVVIAKDPDERASVERALRPLAWAEARAGRILYAPAVSAADLRAVAGVSPAARLVVVEANAFGTKGSVLAQTGDASPAALEKALDDGLRAYKPVKKDVREQIAQGRREGVHWTPEIPVTDPDERRAR